MSIGWKSWLLPAQHYHDCKKAPQRKYCACVKALMQPSITQGSSTLSPHLLNTMVHSRLGLQVFQNQNPRLKQQCFCLYLCERNSHHRPVTIPWYQDRAVVPCHNINQILDHPKHRQSVSSLGSQFFLLLPKHLLPVIRQIANTIIKIKNISKCVWSSEVSL